MAFFFKLIVIYLLFILDPDNWLLYLDINNTELIILMAMLKQRCTGHDLNCNASY